MIGINHQRDYKKAAESLSFDDKLAMIEQAVAAKQKLEMTYLKANDTIDLLRK